jgi:hypothetical protein
MYCTLLFSSARQYNLKTFARQANKTQRQLGSSDGVMLTAAAVPDGGETCLIFPLICTFFGVDPVLFFDANQHPVVFFGLSPGLNSAGTAAAAL